MIKNMYNLFIKNRVILTNKELEKIISEQFPFNIDLDLIKLSINNVMINRLNYFVYASIQLNFINPDEPLETLHSKLDCKFSYKVSDNQLYLKIEEVIKMETNGVSESVGRWVFKLFEKNIIQKLEKTPVLKFCDINNYAFKHNLVKNIDCLNDQVIIHLEKPDSDLYDLE